VSLNERDPKGSKIGLTMRQTGLGKIEWLEALRRGEISEAKAEVKEQVEERAEQKAEAE
jgi:DNA-directed RNA polymerase, subunit E' (EC 2.7.7.6)